MRVTSVELRPEGSSEVIDLSFRDPRSLNPFQIKSISPLDADELTPQFYGRSGDSTKKYYNIALKKREPVALIGLNPRFGAPDNNSYSELRDRLYRLVSSSRTGVVEMRFKADGVAVASISGTVSKVEASQFTDKPEVQITFNCPDPMIKSLERVELVTEPFVQTAIEIADEVSTAAHGFKFTAEFTAAEGPLILSDDTVDWQFVIQRPGGFLEGDVLHFSSEFLKKELYMMRGSTKIYLADAVIAGSIWPLIFPGANQLNSNVPLNWTSIQHYVTYWGV